MEKISAVLIAKNEQKLIGRCLRSVAGLDETVVLDTGSTDKTIEVARSLGATVKAVEPVSPFHFANARNSAHELATNDWILAIDADEILRAGMLSRIRAAVNGQMSKDPLEKANAFIITFTDRGAVTHKKKLYRKSVWKWTHRVHEELIPLGTDAKEVMLESVVMEHLPDPDKSARHGQNVELLKISIQEEPDFIRAWKYLGQELMKDKAYLDAIPYLAHYVDKTKDSPLEVSEGMLRVAQCYAELKDYEPAVRWFEMSAQIDSRRREPLFNAGQYLMSKKPLSYGDVVEATRFFQRCLAIPVSSKPGSHHDQTWAWGNRPRQLLQICQEHLKQNTPR